MNNFTILISSCCKIYPIPSPSLKHQLYIASSPSTERVRIVTELKDMTVTAGQDAEFVCELSHADVDEGVWWLGSSPLQKNEMNQMTCRGRQHKLVLTMTTPEETGTVAFVVGEERTSAQLLVVPKAKGEQKHYFGEDKKISSEAVTLNRHLISFSSSI